MTHWLIKWPCFYGLKLALVVPFVKLSLKGCKQEVLTPLLSVDNSQSAGVWSKFMIFVSFVSGTSLTLRLTRRVARPLPPLLCSGSDQPVLSSTRSLWPTTLSYFSSTTRKLTSFYSTGSFKTQPSISDETNYNQSITKKNLCYNVMNELPTIVLHTLK